MSIFWVFRRQQSAPFARQRLQALLSHERTTLFRSGILESLHKEVLGVIGKQIALQSENVQVHIDRGATRCRLGISVEIPHSMKLGAKQKFLLPSVSQSNLLGVSARP